MEPATAALIARAAIAAGTNKKVWTGIASVLAALCLPVILAVMCYISIASGGTEHNRAAVHLAFDGGEMPDGMPADYQAYVRQMQESFAELDAILDDIDGMTEGELCDGTEVLIPGIMEHIERAGVHSGDSIAVYPPRNLSESVIKTIIDYTNRMALGLEVKGMINIQYIVRNNEVYVIEVNPRSSRTVPFLSKVTNVPMINVATKAAMGHSLRELGYKPGLGFFPDYYAVKAPVFSFNKMSNVDITLGPEMKSTGEVMCVDYQYSRALYKACIASGINVPHEGSILITVADMDKPEAAEIAAGFADLGYEIMATGGTAEYLKEKGVKVTVATKVSEGSPNILDDIKEGRISMVINTTNHGRDAERDGFKIRRSTVEHAIACLTSMDTARELQHVMSAMRRRRVVSIVALQDLAWEG